MGTATKTLLDGDGQILHDGERVFSYDFDGSRIYGTLYSNDEYPHVSDWYISYDDGEECAVLNEKLVFKA